MDGGPVKATAVSWAAGVWLCCQGEEAQNLAQEGSVHACELDAKSP